MIQRYYRAGSLVIVITLLVCLSGSAAAADLAGYQAKVDKARVSVSSLLALTAESETGERDSGSEKIILDLIRSDLPATEKIEWMSQTVETDNQWIHTRLANFENETDSTKRAINLTETDELLSALSVDLDAVSASAALRSKDEDKRKLAEILARDEYQKPEPKKESGLAALIERFLNWVRGLFPESSNTPQAPFDFSSFAQVLQVLLYVGVFSVLTFFIYKFAPLLFPRMQRVARAKKSHRTILGERISAHESSADLFTDAERLARDGEIRAAIRKGYIALLCELSDKNVIALEKHKTNRDYLRDVRRLAEVYGNMRGLTSSFERHWYGDQPTASGDWDTFREQYKKAVAAV